MCKFYIAILMILCSLKSYSQEAYIYSCFLTAIEDFVKTSARKESNVFSISSANYRVSRNHNLVELIKVSISSKDSSWTFLMSNSDSIGKPYIYNIGLEERDGKLFYWDKEGEGILTQEIYDKLTEYNFIKHVDVPSQEWLVGAIGCFDDSKKVTQYYFELGNSRKFKKTRSIWTKIPIMYKSIDEY